jgi:hypothetical protein
MEKYMLNPTHLCPAALGLEWGLSKQECTHILSESPSLERLGSLHIPAKINGKILELRLYFQVPDHPEVTRIYDWEGNMYDWASGTMWDKDDNLVDGTANDKLERSGLFRVETTLSTSRFLTRDTMEEIEMRAQEEAEYLSKYSEAIEQCTNILGDPVFSGRALINVPTSSGPNWIRNPAYPRGQYGDYLTNWIYKGGVIQVALRSGEDDGFPIDLVVACYRD